MPIGYGFARPPVIAAVQAREGNLFCIGILFSAVFFNFALAIINRHVTPLSPGDVILAEVAIVAATHAVCLLRFRDLMAPWYMLLWFMVMVALGRWLWLADIDPKSLRDVIIIPTFICLGIAAGRRNLNATILVLQWLVLIAMLIEAIFPQGFGNFVGIKSYYINTRGFRDSQFWNVSSEYFVSATRPGDRFVGGWLGIHRLSSIFLEPVSLGNYCIAVTAFVCARFRTLSRGQIVFLAASNLVLLVGCDGRLAIATSILLVAITMLLGAVRRLSVLYLPAALAFALFLYVVLGFRPGVDNFTGRVAFTVERLWNFSTLEFLGLSPALPDTADSGIAYLIATQSIFGLLALFATIFLYARDDEDDQASFKSAMLLYLSLTMMVSYSFLTIKTASISWYLLGALQVPARAKGLQQRGRDNPRPGARPHEGLNYGSARGAQ